MKKLDAGTSLDGLAGLTVPQLDALALTVRMRAAKYLTAIEQVKELVAAMEGENAMKQKLEPGRRESGEARQGKGDGA